MTKGEEAARFLFSHREGHEFFQVTCGFCPDWKTTQSERAAAMHFDSAEHNANVEECEHSIRLQDLAKEMERLIRELAKGYLSHGHMQWRDSECLICQVELLIERLDGKDPQ